MSLSDKQWEFLKDVAKLIQYAESVEGYKLTASELYRTPEQAALNAKTGKGISNSLHTKKLAIDLNLFINGKYMTSSEDYKVLGDYWKSLHPENAWGGDFKGRPDGNHFSRRHRGVA